MSRPERWLKRGRLVKGVCFYSKSAPDSRKDDSAVSRDGINSQTYLFFSPTAKPTAIPITKPSSNTAPTRSLRHPPRRATHLRSLMVSLTTPVFRSGRLSSLSRYAESSYLASMKPLTPLPPTSPFTVGLRADLEGIGGGSTASSSSMTGSGCGSLRERRPGTMDVGWSGGGA